MLLLYTVTLSLCLLLKLNDDDDDEFHSAACKRAVDEGSPTEISGRFKSKLKTYLFQLAFNIQ